MNNTYSLLISSITVLTLTACAGGGGGGSSSSSNGNVTVTTTGFSGQSNWTSTADGTVTSVSPWVQGTTGLTYTETVNASNIVQSNSITSSSGTVLSFNVANGDTIATIPAGPLAYKSYLETKADGNDLAIIAPSSMNGWSYQGYGIWITNLNSTSGTVGGGTTGTEFTSGIAIPTSGTGTFTGTSSGVYTNSSGIPYLTGSNMTAGVDFANRTLNFATTGTYLVSPSGWVAASGLNTTGSLSYASGTNLVTGSNLATAGGGGVSVMTGGTVTAKFYGPTANEIGGSFAVRAGAGVESYAGAFGGKR